ncbi:MAG: indole-3-glycerol phosphate synthase [Desulfobacteraceae bacterium Eth-SRB1]|nr:MAG: indole-3-glycerol phosphate synthase [Desulfobacteraceae bacterium Eth-SRB1]
MNKDFLTKIIADKKEEIAAAKRSLPESLVRDKAAVSQKRRMFLKKLEQPGPSGINIIAEIKRASPSKGEIRGDINPAVYAAEYEHGGAAALSVLTDRAYFKGSIKDFKAARQAVTIPVLRKDFLISTYQIYESAVIGADAVLLIARILSPNQLKDYLNLCNELTMDALVEINTKENFEIATNAGARLIGINNRDLSSFKTDINTTINMASLIKPDQVAVAASGINTREDIEKIQKAGIWNFLIGESLMRSSNPSAFLMNLMGKK